MVKAGSHLVGVGRETSAAVLKGEKVRAGQVIHGHPLCLPGPSCPQGAAPLCPGGSLLRQMAKKAARKGDISRRKMCRQDEVF